MVPLLVFKMVELTLKHGLCEYSPPAFANLGLILAGNLEDFRGAARIADYTVKMMAKVKCKNTKARSILLLNWAVFTWSRPLQSLLKVRLITLDVAPAFENIRKRMSIN